MLAGPSLTNASPKKARIQSLLAWRKFISCLVVVYKWAYSVFLCSIHD
jgi:hypothetical protein